jgi:hypothetical protein
MGNPGRCETEIPALVDAGDSQLVACHFRGADTPVS